jgi:hypothetical protein
MSDIIPPILSSTPPPLADIADDDDDFGDFAVADDPFQTDNPDTEPGKTFFCQSLNYQIQCSNSLQARKLPGTTIA